MKKAEIKRIAKGKVPDDELNNFAGFYKKRFPHLYDPMYIETWVERWNNSSKRKANADFQSCKILKKYGKSCD